MEQTDVATRAEHDAVYRLIMAGWGSQVVRTVASFSVAEHLEAGPLPARQIAGRLSSDPDMTFRLLRAAAAMGFLTYDLLRANSPAPQCSTSFVEIVRSR